MSGLDSDIEKVPQFLLDTSDPIFYFNQKIMDATAAILWHTNQIWPFTNQVAWMVGTVWKTVHYIREKYPDIFIIADAKRGDYWQHLSHVRQNFFETYQFDAVTIAPYMGEIR